MTPSRGVVLLLSGGGAKAAAHVGAVRALAEAGITPARIIGTSMGAVIGACIGSGLEPEAILRRLLDVGSKGIVRSLLAPWAASGWTVSCAAMRSTPRWPNWCPRARLPSSRCR